MVSLGSLAEGGHGLYSSSSEYPGTLYCIVCTVCILYKYLYVNTVCILYTCISIQDLDTVCILYISVFRYCMYRYILYVYLATVSTSCIYDIIPSAESDFTVRENYPVRVHISLFYPDNVLASFNKSL